MQYTDLVVSTEGLSSGYTAPEEMRSRAALAWYRAFKQSGLVSLDGELDKSHQQDGGTWILGWLVGEDEHYYYVIFDPANHRVTTEKRGKAKRREGAGRERDTLEADLPDGALRGMPSSATRASRRTP